MPKNETIKSRISELLEAHFAETDWFLVEVKVLPNNLVQVFVDRDTAYSIEDLRIISRMLEKTLNEELDFSTAYGLEVSSPGIDRPLVFFRQYLKNIGRKVEVELNDGKKVEGKLEKLDEKKLELMLPEKKKSEKEIIEIPFSNIKQTTILITF